jgi:anaerobic selenocysteine-containing dehydrogenase
VREVRIEQQRAVTHHALRRDVLRVPRDLAAARQDVIPAAAAGYPYPIKALWLHMGTPAYSVPGGKEQIAMLRDTKAIPLFIATDLVIGETTMYADYVFPDLSYLERWASPGDVPQPAAKSNPFRQPAAAPIPETVTVFGEEMPISMEAVMLAIAERLQLPGYGDNGFGDGVPLKRPEDYYLKLAANLAFGDKEDGSETLPDADDAEVQLFKDARSHFGIRMRRPAAGCKARPRRKWLRPEPRRPLRAPREC